MQVLRQTFINTIQRPLVLVRQVRFEGSDPRSSTKPEKHRGLNQSSSTHGSDLNKTQGDQKKQKTPITDDTKQPGTTRKDWSQPNKVVGNDPSYGKASKS
ncbi:unnamed protein product [Adineta ricciae]|uniref:Uncharacterized protein n=1 Tax=Adineta ricciae TaxID=249248 RepID=A0A815GBZ0_ADIRI|nr:unnamed protein product [Adineta ricciae]